MRKIFKFIAVAVIAVIFVGCKVQYIPVPVNTKVDSIYVEKIVERVDTLKIEIPSETVYVVQQDSSHIETSVAFSDAFIDSTGVLHHRLENKKGALEKQVVYKDRIIEKEKIVEKEVPVVTEVEKKVEVVPQYYKTINIIFWSVVAGLLLGFVIFIVCKLKLH